MPRDIMRGKTWIACLSMFLCWLLLAPVLSTENITSERTPVATGQSDRKPGYQFPANMTDVPVWEASMQWNYTVHGKTKGTSGDGQEIFANTTTVVLGNETFNLNGTNYNCYHTKNTIEMTGHGVMSIMGFPIPYKIDGNNSNAPNPSVPAVFIEEQYIRMSDLGSVFTQSYQHMYIHAFFQSQWMLAERMSLSHSYGTPVSEDMDFPVFVGDEWFMNLISHSYGWEYLNSPQGGYNNSYVDRTNMSYKADCTIYENAGLTAFPTMYGFKIEYTDNINTQNIRSSWVNSTVKNTIKMYEYSDAGGNKTDNWVNLTDYKPAPSHVWETTISIDPMAQNITENVVISGIIKPYASGDVVIEILDTPYQWVVGPNPGGDFSTQIAVPLLMDFTPTSYDVGSVGVIAYPAGEPMRYNVTTLTALSKAGTLLLTLKPGWNLVSVPLISYDTCIPWTLGSISYLYDHVCYYDPADNASHWKFYEPSKPSYMGGFENANNTIGFWVHVNFPVDVKLVVSGTEPTSTNVCLKKGWNMIGYPSSLSRLVSQFKTEIVGGACTAVYGFNLAATYRIRSLDDTDVMGPGYGYWVYVDADSTWTVIYK